MIMMRVFLLVGFMVLAFAPEGGAQEMTIEQAYRAIPHKQTPYDYKQSRIRAVDAKYLDHYFFAADVALRARVMCLRGFYGQKGGIDVVRYNREVNDMVNSFSLVDTPSHLKEAEVLLISAVRDQQAFFNAWEDARGTPRGQKYMQNLSAHPKVQSAHRKLIQAYSVLKRSYPQESARNQSAFYDHLCALDFI